MKDKRKVGMTSSPHGPYELGYTRATMENSIGSNLEKGSKSPNLSGVRIDLCNSRS